MKIVTKQSPGCPDGVYDVYVDDRWCTRTVMRAGNKFLAGSDIMPWRYRTIDDAARVVAHADGYDLDRSLD